ncbi:Clathrin interactor EPSIN 2 [Spatholobus suberectus]|nr:Clathrin interactor EPSIN 2 [Spatholobus suberectus]
MTEKTLTVLEYLVAYGSSGRDQGNNVRKKSLNLVLLVNDKERIVEVRQKVSANRDKFHNNAIGGMFRLGSCSSSGANGDKYDDDRCGSREEDRSGCGYRRGREWNCRDDDRHSRDGDRYAKYYKERYGKDRYKDDDYMGRN